MMEMGLYNIRVSISSFKRNFSFSNLLKAQNWEEDDSFLGEFGNNYNHTLAWVLIDVHE